MLLLMLLLMLMLLLLLGRMLRLLLLLLLSLELLLLLGHLECQQFFRVQRVKRSQIWYLLEQLAKYVRMLRMILSENGLKSVAKLVVHTLDEIGVSETRSVGRYDNDRTKQTELGVRQSQSVDPLGEVEHRVHEETGVAAVVNRFSLEHLTVQAYHTVRLGVEHTRETHEEHLEDTGLQ